MINKRLFAKNSISGLLQKVLIAFLTFYTIPLFINLLGSQMFGIFSTIRVIGDLNRLVNVGFQIALIKFISQQGKTKESNYDIIVGFSTMLLIAAIISILLVIFNKPVIVNIFNIPIDNFSESRALYIFLVLSNMLLLISIPLNGVLESQKRIYLVNALHLVYSILHWGLIILILKLGYALKEVGLMSFLASLTWFLLTLYYCRKIWGRFEIREIRLYFMSSLKKQLKYSLKVYFSGMLGILLEPVIKILVSNLFGVTYVGFLDIGIRVKNQLFEIINRMMWPLFQLFSEIKDKDHASKIISDIQLKTFIFLIPSCLCLIFCAEPIVELWIGDNIEIISKLIIIVTCSSLIGVAAVQPTFYYLIAHRPNVLIFNQFVMIILRLSPILILHNKIGFDAIYVSYLLSFTLHILLGIVYGKRYVGESVIPDGRTLLKILLYFIILLIISYLFIQLTDINSIALLVSLPSILFIVSIILIRSLRLVTKDDIIRYLGDTSVISKSLARLFRTID